MLSFLALTSVIAMLLLSVEALNKAFAQPCYPSDPGGNNPQNPCPLYPPPGIRSDSFVGGRAEPIREIPTVTNPAGRVIAAPSGYWSGSQAESGIRIIRTNQGKIYRLNSQ